MTRTRRVRPRPRKDLRQVVDRIAVERLLSETTVLRVTQEFIEERGLGAACAGYLERRSR
ncbi:MAG: hypothetical protein HY905_04030 [Deltaproteobacteria bacterium]|nr:hypothetical protein [Deltaproteobacteria bacterium]